MQPESTLNSPPSRFAPFFIQDNSRLQFCPSVPCSSPPVSVKTAKNGPVKSRSAVLNEAFGIYECRGLDGEFTVSAPRECG